MSSMQAERVAITWNTTVQNSDKNQTEKTKKSALVVARKP